MTIDAGHKNNIKVHLCGDLGGNEHAIPILLGLGIDDFSMSASLIPEARYVIRNSNLKKTQKLAATAVNLSTAQEVRELVETYLKRQEIHQEPLLNQN
jgi:phosphotransferase system enzyme I (PtsI)